MLLPHLNIVFLFSCVTFVSINSRFATMTINFAIIGFGKMGQIRAKTLSSFENVNISKIYNLSPVNSKYSQVDDYSEIIEDKSIDAVVICMPNKFNFEITVKSLRNNKHVFCEKPPSFTSNEVQEIMQAERKSNKKVSKSEEKSEKKDKN